MTCHWCRADVSHGDYVHVSLADGSIARCCGDCWEKADRDWTVRLSYEGDSE